MKKKFYAGLAGIACAGLLVTGTGAIAYAAQNETPVEPQAVLAEASENNPGTQLLESVEKDEMVYVLTDASGKVNKIIVSDWLKNAVGSGSINDTSELMNVELLRGAQGYSDKGNGALVWDAQGEDVYYQGQIEKELPVDLSVSYWLDGKSIAANDLAGKSGKVTIRFDYTNKQYEMVEIDGKEEKIYVPFVMMTGMMLDNDVFRNVEVSNGKVVNDGGRTVVVGIAFPGLQSNLKADAEKFEIPSYVEITADVTDFELANTVTIATKEPFDQIDADKLDAGDALDELTDSLDLLDEAMGQLLDGSSQLYDGLCTLLDKSGELATGVNQLADGAGQLRDGLTTANSGAAALAGGASQLVGGANTLKDGLNTLDANSAALNDGARQVFETLLATATTQLNAQLAAMGQSIPALTIENYGEVLTGVLQKLDPDAVYAMAQDKVTEEVNANRDKVVEGVMAAVQEQVRAKVTAAVQEQVRQQVTAAVQEQVRQQVAATVQEQVRGQVTAAVFAGAGIDQATYDALVAAGDPDGIAAQLQEAINSALAGQMASAEVQALIDANVSEQMAGEQVQGTISANTAAQMAGAEVQALIEANVSQQMASADIQAMVGSATEEQIANLIASNMNSELVLGQISAAQSGAAQIAALKAQLDSYSQFYAGLTQYTAGVAAAKDGAGALSAGAAQLSAGADQLVDGTKQLQSGSAQLYDGINQLKGNLPALTEGVTALRDGAMQLSGGLEEFNEKGIQKLIDAAEGGLDGLTERIRATADVSRRWNSFSGISDEMSGTVNFFYRTDAIEKKEA